MLIWLLKYSKQIVLAICLTSILYFAYNAVYTRAERDVSQRYEQRWAEYTKTIDTHIVDLQLTSTKLIELNDSKAKVLDGKINQILVLSKDKPLVIVKNGKCTLSENFINSYNSLVSVGTKQ